MAGIITIFGASASCEALIEQLVQLGYQITLVDNDLSALTHFEKNYNIITIHGKPSHPEVIKSSLSDETQYLIAMTQDDETNLLTCYIAKSITAVTTITCIHDSAYLSKSENIYTHAIDYTIHINQSIIEDIKHIFIHPEFIHANYIGGGYLSASVKLTEDHPWTGISLEKMENSTPKSCVISGLYRDGVWRSFRKNTRTTEGDILLVVIHQDQLASIANQPPCTEILFLGNSTLAISCCQYFSKQNTTTLLEPNKKLCNLAASQLPKTEVIHTNPENKKTLMTMISRNQTVAALSPDDENNLVYSFQAYDTGALQTFNLINKIREGHIFESSPISHMVLKTQIISDHIMRNILSEKKVCYYYTRPNLLQLIILEILPEHPFCNQTINDLSLDPHIIIGCIIRDEKPLFTEKTTALLAGDKLLIYTPHKAHDSNPAIKALLSQ
ncbi:NAD-binding protein [Candidatus Comchoanobacter bicostacola]|uniref:NAD-binding protein n=1 Tax=Candidatus Comchoanobacter bicostacola TaxID=2919598 RepID=A0ABY5DJL0_9GAMM|nr:NAD-binding protein [Candidatus Comchoanobacter bicostacola]UTC24486.1 NAD-binding protein [Candidatus Comchoanobacter bicostacola]